MNAVDTVSAPSVVRSQLAEWGRFVAILMLVLSPLIVLGAALEALAWQIGETMPIEMIARWQDGASARIWRGGDGHSYLTYKLARIADLKPDIIALGPSRANAFRGEVFAPYSFYNAGLTTWTIDQDNRFLELITRDGHAPRALIFTLDYWMFSAGFDHYWSNRFDEQPTTHVADFMRVVGQLAKDPVDLWHRLPATGRQHGLHAVLTGDGFRADGSLPEKPPTSDPARLQADATEAGTPPAVFADRISAEQVAKLGAFVALAKAKHVALIGIQLPFYKKILDGLNSNPQAGIWREFESDAWRRQLAESGVVFFDFADRPEYRDNPAYFIDSLDPSLRAVNEIMRKVMADPRVTAVLPKGEGR